MSSLRTALCTRSSAALTVLAACLVAIGPLGCGSSEPTSDSAQPDVGPTPLDAGPGAGDAAAADDTGTGDGGSGAGSASATGSIAGRDLVPQDAVATRGPSDFGEVVQVLVTDYAAACSIEQANQRKANSVQLRLVVQHMSKAGPVEPGTYPINEPSGGQAEPVLGNAIYYTRDQTCSDKNFGELSGGTIVFTSVTASRIAGSFVVEYTNGKVEGEFDAPICVVSDGPTSCAP